VSVRVMRGILLLMRVAAVLGIWLSFSGVCWLVGARGTTEAPRTTEVSQSASASADESEEIVAPKTPQAAGTMDDGVPPGIVPAKFFRHAERLLAKYDGDGHGQPGRAERAAMPKGLWAADGDRDGVITVDELAEYLATYGRWRSLGPTAGTWQAAFEFLPLLRPSTPTESASGRDAPPTAEQGETNSPATASTAESLPGRQQRGNRKFFVPPSRLPQGLPDWFTARDADGDGQLTFGEFAPEGGQAAFEQFQRYDLNRDGVLTPAEVLQAGRTPGSAKQPATHAEK
jgi:hypothetical protein